MEVKQQILNLTQDLIKIPSISNDIPKLHEIVNFVKSYFEGIWYIKEYIFNNKPSIIISNFEWKQADVVLNWHLDVVPPSEENQFNPTIKDGKLYGRGAWDMKSWVAIMMVLMRSLLKKWFSKKKVSLILTTDEEVGGFDWVWKLVELWYGWEIVLIPDGWSLKEIVHAEKGIIHLTVRFKGRSCHSSRPWLWENAIDKAIKFYQALRLYLQDDRKLYFTETHRWTSVNLNIINWGIATNVIPDQVEAEFDIRFTEEFNKDEILQFVRRIADRFDWDMENILVWNLLYTDVNDILIQNYYSIAKKIIWEDVIFVKEHGASDWKFFVKKSCKVILHRPTCWNLHWKREWVKIDDFDKIYKCYEEFILS